MTAEEPTRQDLERIGFALQNIEVDCFEMKRRQQQESSRSPLVEPGSECTLGLRHLESMCRHQQNTIAQLASLRHETQRRLGDWRLAFWAVVALLVLTLWVKPR